MEDRRCKLGLAGRLQLVRLIEGGCSLRSAAAQSSVSPATAHRWWHRWEAASEAERASLACLRTRSPRPRSCPWGLSAEAEQRILQARARTRYGPARLAGLVGFCRGTIYKVLARHGVSRRRAKRARQTFRRYEWSVPGALLHLDTMKLPKFDRPEALHPRSRRAAPHARRRQHLRRLRHRRSQPLGLLRAAWLRDRRHGHRHPAAGGGLDDRA